METGIRYLDVLERDLQAVAEGEVVLRPAPTRRSVRWKGWLGAVASILVVAFAIGALAELGGGRSSMSSSAAGGSFSSGGSAVDGGAKAPAHGHVATPLPSPAAPATRGASPGGRDLTKIVRDGTVALSIPDGTFDARFAKAVAIANTNGGSVLSSQTEGAATGTLTLRIPAARFDRALLQVRQLGDVTSSSVTDKDMTNQYLDYQAHLQNLVGRRAVLRTVLAKTTTVGESLTVYNELSDVQLQIDQVQGQVRYLNDQTAESTLTVDLREESAPAGQGETNGGIDNPSLSRAFDRAVQGFFGILATIIVGLGYLLPLGVIAGLVYSVVKLVQRRGREAS